MSSTLQNDTDDEEMNMSKASLLRENQGNGPENSVPLCGWATVKFYQPYFDLDTSDVTNRVWTSTFFCRRQETFLEQVKNPDAYGPFWIATTLIFTVAVSSHVSSWLVAWMAGTRWTYDFQNIVTLTSIVYGYLSIPPFIVWLLFRQLEIPLSLISIGCLYGYSLFIYIPAALVNLIPNEIIHWITLLISSATSFSFLLRNLAPSLATNSTGRQNAAFLMGCIGFMQLGLMLALKLLFF